MIGTASVGKSSLLLRFAVFFILFLIYFYFDFLLKDDYFNENYIATMGVDFVIFH